MTIIEADVVSHAGESSRHESGIAPATTLDMWLFSRAVALRGGQVGAGCIKLEHPIAVGIDYILLANTDFGQVIDEGFKHLGCRLARGRVLSLAFSRTTLGRKCGCYGFNVNIGRAVRARDCKAICPLSGSNSLPA